MKKFSLSIIVTVLLTMSYTNAQVSSYTFSSSLGTYTPITGGTAIRYNNAVTNASVTSATLDDDVYYNRPIGFNFNYNGAVYTSFGFNSNGWLILGSSTSFTSTSTPISSSNNNVISAGAVDWIGGILVGGTVVSGDNFITANSSSPTTNINVGDTIIGTGIPSPGAAVTAVTGTTVTIDKNTTSGSTSATWRVKNGEIRYETIGSSPNRTLVLQFSSFSRFSTTAPGDRANFQIRLNETSNTVQVVYSGWSATYTGTGLTLQTGLKGATTTDYNNRTTTANWSASTAGTTNTAAMTYTSTVYPANGLTYTWTPLPIPAVDLTVSAITPSNTTVCPTSNYPILVTIQNVGTSTIDFSSSNAAIAVAITGAATQSLSTTVSSGTLASGASRVITLSPGANFTASGLDSIRATVTISGDGNSNNNSLVTTVTVSPITTVPFSEGFTTTSTPTGWTTSGWSIGTTRGVTGNPGNNIYKNLYSSAVTGEFSTITVGTIASTDSLKFDYKLVNYASPYSAPAAGWGNYKVQISTDCGTTYTTVDSVINSTDTWITKGYSLSAYSGLRIKVKILATWTTGDWDLAFDNFRILTTLPCATPASVSVGSNTSTSAAINFTGTGNSYIVEYGATGFTPGTGATAGTGGTVVTGSSSPISISGLSAGTTYQVYVRQNCSSSGAGFSYNTAVVSFSTTPGCVTNVSPATGSSGVSSPVTLTWNATTGATSYTVYLGTANPPTDSITTVTGTSATVSAALANTTYYWYVVPRNSGGPATGCSGNVFRFTTTGGPANDACANAVNLTVSNGFCSSPVLGSLAFADSTAGLGAATCQASALRYDVWYRVAIPASGNVTVQTSAVNTIVTDLVLQAYSGSCGALTAIGCDDDGNPAPAGTPSAAHAKLGLTGRTPGEVVYFRVMPYSTLTNAGAFSICAFDTTASVAPAVAVGTRGACTAATTVVADSAWKYAWVPLKDASGNIIAELYPNGNILGSTTASFYINNGAVRRDPNGTYYLDRNITINPTNQPNTSIGNVTTRLYFTSSELATFVTAAGATTRAQLNVTKTTQTCAASAVAAGGVLLSQSTSAAYGSDSYVEVSNPSFSTFYLHRGATPLPIKFEYLTGKKVGSTNALNWKVSCTSTSITMVLERSADARRFDKAITTIKATQARCGEPFDAVDATPLNGISYYRLQMIDVDGTVSYSPVVAVLNGKAGAELVGIYPTVVKGQAYLSITSSRNTTMQFSISDMTGKVIKTISQAVSSGSSLLPVSTSSLASGVYNITGLLDGTRTQTLRFVKE